MAYLRLRNVIKSYDGKTNAVDNITVDIDRGEFVTFLGPSGSGKTTTLLLIAGFEYPTGGMIELGGADLSLSRPYERNIGTIGRPGWVVLISGAGCEAVRRIAVERLNVDRGIPHGLCVPRECDLPAVGRKSGRAFIAIIARERLRHQRDLANIGAEEGQASHRDHQHGYRFGRRRGFRERLRFD